MIVQVIFAQFLTGGTKPMPIGAYEYFKAKGARLVYINYSKPNDLLDLNGQPPEKLNYQPSIHEFLAGYGFVSRKKNEDVAAAESVARRRWDCPRSIAAWCPEQTLLRIGDLRDPAIKSRWDVARKKGIELEPGQLAPEDLVVCESLATTLGLERSPVGLRGKLDRHAVVFVTGGWLEEFLWGLLDRLAAALEIWDVRLGVQPVRADSPTSSDFDVAFMRGSRLCMMECKSGSQVLDPNTEALHKVEAVVRQFRALGVSSYLANTSANILGADGTLRPGIRDRAAIYNCTVLTRDEIRQFAQSPDDVNAIRQVLVPSKA